MEVTEEIFNPIIVFAANFEVSKKENRLKMG